MCDTLLSPQEILRRGEASTVFAHAAACRTCRNALLEQGAYPPGCSDPQLGFEVAVHLDAIASGGAEPKVLEHLERCVPCALDVREAQDALEELAASASTGRTSSRCGHCDDPVTVTSASCASCTSRHHAPCFDDHGECAVCGDRSYVQGHPRLTFPRWLIGGLLLVIGATAADPAPQRLLALRESAALEVPVGQA